MLLGLMDVMAMATLQLGCPPAPRLSNRLFEICALPGLLRRMNASDYKRKCISELACSNHIASRSATVASRKCIVKRRTITTASNLGEGHGTLDTQQDALEKQKLVNNAVEETVARAEAKARVAAAAASAAGFAVEVAKQQGASEDATEAVGKAADAVAKVTLKAAKAVKKVQESVEMSSSATLAEQDEVVQKEIKRERNKLSKENLKS